MPRQLAFLLYAFFILWLYARERKGRAELSAALWLPVVWMTLLGSRPASVWFGFGKTMETAADSLEGSPFDRIIFQALLVAACVVLVRRQINWRAVFTANRWVTFYFLYLGLSVLWSDYSMVAFKRWIKDAGSAVMVLIILTEANSLQALKTTFLRCAYVLIPLSVLFIKYVPELGRGYDPWTWEPVNIGVTTNKNLLGMSLFICALTLLWTLSDEWEKISGTLKWKPLIGHFLLACMTFWLLSQAHSSTAIGCTFLGICLFVATRVSALRRNLRRIAVCTLTAATFLIIVAPMLGLDKMLVGLLGRDLTFTGRTDIWKVVLAQDINPLIGAGHYSFWLGDRVEKISQTFFYEINEAHNGYLELYLNGGLIGVGLLLAVLVSGWRKNIKEAMTGDSIAGFRLAVLAGTMLYGVTEAVFRFGFVSTALLAVVMASPTQLAASVSEDRSVFVANEERDSPANEGIRVLDV
jgi:exopolysaccharide production protein ExoQ